MTIIEKLECKTTIWNIQTEDDFYTVKHYEWNYFNDLWDIESFKNGKIDYESELGRQLIDVCCES